MLRSSYSQYGQDRYVAEEICKGKRDGFFVEAGAGDGLYISNTLLLEREFGWTGILVEPTSAFLHLAKNRPNCRLERICLAGVHKTVTLIEILDAGQAAKSPDAQENLLMSQTVETAPDRLPYMYSQWGRALRQYEMQAKPLADVLKAHNAPRYIDYLSLDVEGLEHDILCTFPFTEYQFGCLGIERPTEELSKLLDENGYAPANRLGADTFFIPRQPSR
jgi:hypothetical protein